MEDNKEETISIAEAVKQTLGSGPRKEQEQPYKCREELRLLFLKKIKIALEKK
jgi:hypothetical protein